MQNKYCSNYLRYYWSRDMKIELELDFWCIQSGVWTFHKLYRNFINASEQSRFQHLEQKAECWDVDNSLVCYFYILITIPQRNTYYK